MFKTLMLKEGLGFIMSHTPEATRSYISYRLADKGLADLMLRAAQTDPAVNVTIYDPRQTEDALQAAYQLRHSVGFDEDNHPSFYGYSRDERGNVRFGLTSQVPASAEAWRAHVGDMSRIGALVVRLETTGNNLNSFDQTVHQLAVSE